MGVNKKTDWVLYIEYFMLVIIAVATVSSLFIGDSGYFIKGILGLIFIGSCILNRKFPNKYKILDIVFLISGIVIIGLCFIK